HRLEVIKILPPTFSASHQRAIIAIAPGDIVLATYHVIPRAIVAADVDALDIGSWPFVNGKYDRHCMGFDVAIAARLHDRKGEAAPRGLDLHFLDRFLQSFGVVERADAHAR